MDRRRFLQLAAMAGLGTVANPGDLLAQYRFLDPVRVANPLAEYPNRDWERLYRDIFRHDRTFTFLCAPNDTHNCLLRAFVKNNVLVRIEPTYGYGKATDLSGNRASSRWDPRCCQKGLVLGRRLYGDRRVKGAFVRKGFKEWVEKGFPRDPATGRAPAELMKRGWDGFVRVPYAEAYALHAKALENITRTYSGEPGKQYLLAQGYDPAMVEAMGGAGVRTIKVRGGMAKLGATRIVGTYRFGNMLALLDAAVRGVGADRALGGTAWDSYSWHTDLPPGHPMVHGDQTSDFELFDVENANLVVVWGMNWITTKMPDSHWLTEARLQGHQGRRAHGGVQRHRQQGRRGHRDPARDRSRVRPRARPGHHRREALRRRLRQALHGPPAPDPDGYARSRCWPGTCSPATRNRASPTGRTW